MTRLKKSIAFACLATFVAVSVSPTALAFRAPIGAVSGVKKLDKGMGNADDLSFSPILLEMAKLIGRTGLPPGFFLQNDGPLNDEQGVDLRTLLLYQAGLIKMPIRLITGRKAPVQDEPLPTLVLQHLPDPRASRSEITSNSPVADGGPKLASTPLPRDPEQHKVITPKANIGSPDKIQIADSTGDARPAPSQMVSLDISKLEAELKMFGEDHSADEVKADVPQLAMAMPRTNVMPFITNNSFRLWTFRAEGKPYAAQAAANETGTGGFNGTFVVSTTGAIKSITGRHFVLSPGKLLACNQGGELLFKTALAEISVEPNATAVIQVMEQSSGTVVKVYSLETLSGSTVTVNVPGQKPQSVSLAAGQALIVADHPLASVDLTGTITAKKLNATTARGSFDVKDFVEHDLIASPQAHATDAEHYGALSALKKRVEQH
jgi:hypothetical protein